MMGDAQPTAPDRDSNQHAIPGGRAPTSRFLNDAQWKALERVLPPPDGNNLGQAEADRREFVEALFWMSFHGCGWSDLPAGRWNAESLRKKRQRWRERGWLVLLQDAARANDELPDWLLVIAIAAFDSGPVPGGTSRATAERAANREDEIEAGTPNGTRGHVPDASAHVPRASQRTSRGTQAGRGNGRAAGRDAGQDEPVARTVALDQATMEELAKLIGAAIGSSGAGGRGRARGRSELSVVWGDVPTWAKAGFAVAIALLTCMLMAPAYLHGMSPFVGDLHKSFEIAIWAAWLLTVFGPPAFVVLVVALVWFLVRHEQRLRDRARAAEEAADA